MYLLLLAPLTAARADVFAENDRLMFQVGPYVKHFSYSPDHNDYPWLVGLEWESASRFELGVAYFKNSFDQPSVYAYAGKRWFLKPADEDGLYLKLTGGPLYGYRGQYENKVPFNHDGLGVAIIPAVGYQYERFNAQVVFLGAAAIMFTLGFDVAK